MVSLCRVEPVLLLLHCVAYANTLWERPNEMSLASKCVTKGAQMLPTHSLTPSLFTCIYFIVYAITVFPRFPLHPYSSFLLDIFFRISSEVWTHWVKRNKHIRGKINILKGWYRRQPRLVSGWSIIIRAQIQLMNLDWIKRSAQACWLSLPSKIVFLWKLIPSFKLIFSLPSRRSLPSLKFITVTAGVISISY